MDVEAYAMERAYALIRDNLELRKRASWRWSISARP
jgi:hypothetical protein